MTPAPGTEELERECAVLCRLLSGSPPEPKLVEAYVRGHQHESLATAPTSLDQLLLASARKGIERARWADAYAAILQRRGLLRRKLVLIFALLETNAPSHVLFERAPQSRLLALWGLVRSGTLGILRLLTGIVWFGPRHLLTGKGSVHG